MRALVVVLVMVVNDIAKLVDSLVGTAPTATGQAGVTGYLVAPQPPADPARQALHEIDDAFRQAVTEIQHLTAGGR